ncbi:MAG: ubiA [Gammaproteobacteria bacterium]|jgi:4-hydroxybenzoate polyprenyltransferase|nr:ubiA [Gammaproteobacteria bacterium]
MKQKLLAYARLMRLHKPVGILLLLWPTWWALWLAALGLPSFKNWFIFTVGVVVMRSAGCVVNDLADRNFDGLVKRTRDRPLVTGSVTPIEAWILLATLCAIGLILVLFLNLAVFLWACLALVLALIYPLTKRFFPMPQAILGLGWYLAIPMAFAAQAKVNAVAFWLYLGAVAWTIVYDTWYAMVDRDDDLKIGIRSSAILFGRYDRLWVAIFQAFALGAWFYVGILAQLQWLYFAACIGCVGLFVYQQILAYRCEPKRCFQAFLNNQWLGLILFLGIVLAVR